jgi:hypothetical protein
MVIAGWMGVDLGFNHMLNFTPSYTPESSFTAGTPALRPHLDVDECR